jgi:hypothetical protein
MTKHRGVKGMSWSDFGDPADMLEDESTASSTSDCGSSR